MAIAHQDTVDQSTLVETGGGSAVRSHQSFDPHVEAICHHSGRYLTRAEVYPQLTGLLREQHDFPGLPELDRAFQKAAHAYEHQHLVWNRHGVAGLARMLAGLMLLGTATFVLTHRDQVSGVLTTWGFVEFVVVYTLIVAGAVSGVALLVWGGWLVARRQEIFHRQAAGQAPAMNDFPLLSCSYDVEARERLRIDIGNAPSAPTVEPLPSELVVRLYPDASSIAQSYQRYQQAFAQHAVGTHLYAGTMALENVRGIECSALEFEHRLLLRVPVPASLREGTYREGWLVGLSTPYRLKPHVLFRHRDGGVRAPLECVPRLRPNDSYTLELHFRWLGDPGMRCRMEECRLVDFPPELGAVRHVELGRYDTERQEVVWRNLGFRQPRQSDRAAPHVRLGEPAPDEAASALVVSVTFSHPLLSADVLLNQPLLSGSYRCVLDGLVSEVRISPERIWNALGRRVTSEQIPTNIELSSILSGQVAIDLRRLSQDHEHVLAERLRFHSALEPAVVDRALRVLVERCAIDVQRIEQATPRLDPSGTLQSRLNYWDITGRQYDLTGLHAVDVHLVIAGYDHMVHAEADAAHSWIDLRVRCLHDPRDTGPRTRTASLLSAIVHGLQQELGPGITS